MEFDFKQYVLNKRSEGFSDKQIATLLGMSLKHFLSKLKDEEVEKAPKPEVSEPVKDIFIEQKDEPVKKSKSKKEKKKVVSANNETETV